MRGERVTRGFDAGYRQPKPAEGERGIHMYARREEVMVAPDKHREFREAAARRGELAKAQPGFQLQVLLRSLGYPAKYTLLQRWESREALDTFFGTDQWRAFRRENPLSSLVTTTRPVEAYEVVLDVVSQGRQANFAVLLDFTVNVGFNNAQGFEQNRKAVFEFRQQHVKGFVAGRIRRFLGDPTKYLVIQDWESREAAQAGQALPEMGEFFRTHQVSQYTSGPPTQDAYLPISRVVR